MIRLSIFDNYPTSRAGLRYTFCETPDIQITGETGNGADLLQNLQQAPADIVVLGVNNNRKSKSFKTVRHVEITRKIRSKFPDVKILAYANQETDKTVRQMMREGASGFIGQREANERELERAIRQVAAGGIYVGQSDR